MNILRPAEVIIETFEALVYTIVCFLSFLFPETQARAIGRAVSKLPYYLLLAISPKFRGMVRRARLEEALNKTLAVYGMDSRIASFEVHAPPRGGIVISVKMRRPS